MNNDKTSMFDYGMMYPRSMRDAWVGGYLNNPDNYNKNFVQRIVTANKNVSPFLSTPTGGRRGSHLMASSNNRMFPLIQMKEGALGLLPRFEHPQETIQTTTPEQALVLGWNEYKRLKPKEFGYHDPVPYADWMY